MATEQREREDKYDVDPGFVLPELDDAAPSGGRVERAELDIHSVYFDTDRHDLLCNRVTLRRRDGDSDVGWQLKVPDGKARTEIRLGPTSGSAVPKELAELTRGLRYGRPLRPAATLRTARSAVRILDEHGRLVAEIADDEVHATVMGESALISQWREVEVELGTGDEAVLSRIGRRIERAGAVPASVGSKLERALALPDGADPPVRRCGAGGVVLNYLVAQHAAIMHGDLALRRGQDAIHQTRVATRRFRSALRIFADLFDAGHAGAIDQELAWYAELLGAVRDREVQQAHFERAVAELPGELVLGPVAANIGQELFSQQQRHRQALARAMNGKRYLTLLDELAGFVRSPPFTAAAVASPKSLAKLTRRAERRVSKRLGAALGSGEDEALHRSRKAAKRARYALEATAGTTASSQAKSRIKHYKHLQEILGAHQDSVSAASLLRELGASAGTTPGHNGFTYGLLYAREQARADAARDAAAHWKR